MGKKEPFRVEVPGGAERVLLHACCAPCSSAIVECLLAQGIRPVIFYSNANIFPQAEYEIRLNECIRFARAQGLDIVEDAYDHTAWRKCAEGLEHEPERGARCLACFTYRLSRAARYAAEHGFPVLATTLASSRWKDLQQVNAAGEAACAPYPEVTWWAQNWRKGGLQERRNALLKEYGFYNQLFCGCEFSHRPAERQNDEPLSEDL